RNYLVKSMESIYELKEYCDETGDGQVRTMITLVEEFGRQLFNIIKDLRSRIVTEVSKSDVILSTVHKAKGLEYDTVKLLDDDFITNAEIDVILFNRDKVKDADIHSTIEELNILYVAATRAKSKLIV